MLSHLQKNRTLNDGTGWRKEKQNIFKKIYGFLAVAILLFICNVIIT